MNRGFNLSVQFQQRITDAVLLNALKRLVPSHYYFYSNVFRHETDGSSLLEQQRMQEDAQAGGTNYHTRPVHQVLYSELVQKRTVERFDGAVFEELSQVRMPVNVEKPTYYLTLLDEAASGDQFLVFSCNHLFFDGTSAVHFVEDLARHMSRVAPDSEPTEVLFDKATASVAVEPAGDRKCSLFSSSRWFRWWTFVELSIPQFLVKLYRSYLSRAYPNFFRDPVFAVASYRSGSGSRFCMIKYDASDTGRILQKCRQEGTTLTARMAALFAKCVEESFRPHLGSFSSSVEIAVNGRRFYPELDLRYGLYISVAATYLAPRRSVQCGTAQVTSALRQCFDTRRPFMVTGLLGHVNIWNYVKDKIAHGQRGTIEVSNVGVVATGVPGWEPRQVYFSQSVTDTHFACSCVSTKNGGLNIMVAYHKLLEHFEWRGRNSAQSCIADFRAALLC